MPALCKREAAVHTVLISAAGKCCLRVHISSTTAINNCKRKEEEGKLRECAFADLHSLDCTVPALCRTRACVIVMQLYTGVQCEREFILTIAAVVDGLNGFLHFGQPISIAVQSLKHIKTTLRDEGYFGNFYVTNLF
jgi:hypothetical protein